MAAPDVSAVVTLCNKMYDLVQAGHTVRQADYRERALVAAQALGLRDCLIVANLQAISAERILNDEVVHEVDHARRRELHARAMHRFLDAVMTLQRRRAAGTLMLGCCRAAEVSWMQRTLDHEGSAEGYPTNSAPGIGNLVGYMGFIRAACFAVIIIHTVAVDQLPAVAEVMAICWNVVAEAAILMAMPRPRIFGSFAAEAVFVRRMRMFVNLPSASVSADAARNRALEAWRSLERSGVLQQLDIDGLIEFESRARAVERSAAAAAAAAPGLRSCGLASCGAREAHPSHFKSCAGCKGVVYCCKEHQIEHWPEHKAACKAARKAAAEQHAHANAHASECA